MMVLHGKKKVKIVFQKNGNKTWPKKDTAFGHIGMPIQPEPGNWAIETVKPIAKILKIVLFVVEKVKIVKKKYGIWAKTKNYYYWLLKRWK